jgi:hypothetical protein
MYVLYQTIQVQYSHILTKNDHIMPAMIFGVKLLKSMTEAHFRPALQRKASMYSAIKALCH